MLEPAPCAPSSVVQDESRGSPQATSMRTLGYFRNSFIVSFAGIAAGAGLGWYHGRTVSAVLGTAFIVSVLGVLETSLSFDNAVVNATVLRTMTPVWRHRFITWGIAIAVFGMRLVFPLLVVSAVAKIGPLHALRLAALEPVEYARILSSAHVPLGAFGGAFLGMVCLKYFFDATKEVHWVAAIESRLVRLGKFEAIELGLTMIGLLAFARWVPEHESRSFLAAGVLGLVTFIAVDGIASAMEVGPDRIRELHRASAASFLYLEVLDASFSFDGVIGAFALTNDLFVIAIGLGIGAMFVRSLTIMLVDLGTLESYRYLEHGAFYAIGALAALMVVGTVMPVPQAVTGLVGAVLIGMSFWSSIRYRRAARGTSARGLQRGDAVKEIACEGTEDRPASRP